MWHETKLHRGILKRPELWRERGHGNMLHVLHALTRNVLCV